MAEEKKVPVPDDAKTSRGLSSSTGGRSLRQSLDLMKRKKGDRSPKRTKHKRTKSGAKKTTLETKDTKVSTSSERVKPSPEPKRDKGYEAVAAAAVGNHTKKRGLARTTSFNKGGKKDLDPENVLRAQSLEPSKAVKKLGRTKSFNQGMAKLDMVFGRSASKQRGPEETPKVKVLGVSAPRGTIRMSETERLKFIRSLSSSTSMKVMKKLPVDHSIPQARESSLELKGIPQSRLGKNYVKRKVVAKSEWIAKDDAELTVKPGDVILIHSVDSAGWAEGSIIDNTEKAEDTDKVKNDSPAGDTAVHKGDAPKKEPSDSCTESKDGESKQGEGEGEDCAGAQRTLGNGKPLERVLGTEKGMSAPGWFPLKVMLPPGRLQNIPSGVSLMLNAEADGIPVVDDSSIVHEKEETEKTLEGLLEQRPDKKDLEELHIVEEEETNPITRAQERKKIGDLLTGIFSSRKSKKKKSKSIEEDTPTDDEDSDKDVTHCGDDGDREIVGEKRRSTSHEQVTAGEDEATKSDTDLEPVVASDKNATDNGKVAESAKQEEKETGKEKTEKEEETERDEKEREKEKEMTPLAKGVELFNENPSKGIQYFFEQNISIVGNTPDSIARFLYKFTHFDRVQLGEFLGSKGELNEQILDAVLHQLDFTCLEFDMALRRFLYAFRLPGEAQKIDRLMLAFAKKYYEEQQSNAFADVDAIYILAFSVVMLNTDLHNPCIKRKMAVENFVSQNRGVNGGGDFPPELLHDIYDMIMDDEIRDKTQDHFSDAIYRSWCGHCAGTGKRKYKRRWVVVDQSGFFILSSPNTKEPQHVFMYDQITYIKDLGTPKGEFRLMLKNQEEHYFCAKTPRHVKLWVAKVNLMRCMVGYLKVTQMEQQAMLHKAQAKASSSAEEAEEVATKEEDLHPFDDTACES